MMKYLHIYVWSQARSDQKVILKESWILLQVSSCPKEKTSFEKNDRQNNAAVLNHINNEKQDSLNGHSPYQVSRLLLDNRLL